MISEVAQLFSGKRRSEDSEREIAVAAAALMYEIAMLDQELSEAEKQHIAKLVQQHFHLNDETMAEVAKSAQEAVDRAVDYYRFVRIAKERFTHEQCLHLMQLLWQMVYLDGSASSYESSLMTRIAGLLYISGSESADARSAAKKALDAQRKS